MQVTTLSAILSLTEFTTNQTNQHEQKRNQEGQKKIWNHKFVAFVVVRGKKTVFYPVFCPRRRASSFKLRITEKSEWSEEDVEPQVCVVCGKNKVFIHETKRFIV